MRVRSKQPGKVKEKGIRLIDLSDWRNRENLAGWEHNSTCDLKKDKSAPLTNRSGGRHRRAESNPLMLKMALIEGKYLDGQLPGTRICDLILRQKRQVGVCENHAEAFRVATEGRGGGNNKKKGEGSYETLLF